MPGGMRRRIFRIEQMFVGRRTVAAPDHEHVALRALAERGAEAVDATVQGLEQELALLRETLARNKQDLVLLVGDRTDRRMARAAGELGAAIETMEKATKTILDATEAIDDSARSLGLSLKQDYDRGLAQDVQEHAVKIYEACNFQDLAGQRIAKVIAILNTVEEQIAVVLERCNHMARPTATAAKKPAAGNGLVNGPRLDGDAGHADQRDIDVMFA